MAIVRDSSGRLYDTQNGMRVDENALDSSKLREIQRRLGEPTDQDRQAANKAANAAAAAQRAATPAVLPTTPTTPVEPVEPAYQSAQVSDIDYWSGSSSGEVSSDNMVSWRNPVTGETTSQPSSMNPPEGSSWEKGAYTRQESEDVINKYIRNMPRGTGTNYQEYKIPDPVENPFKGEVGPGIVPPYDPNDNRLFEKELFVLPSGSQALHQNTTIGQGSDFGLFDKFGPEPEYNYTYEQALGRRQARDVKSPKERAAIATAIERGPSGQGSDFKNPTDYGFKNPEPDPNNPFGNIAPAVMLDYIGPNGERVSAGAGMIPPPGFTQVDGTPRLPFVDTMPKVPDPFGDGAAPGPIKEMPMYEMEGGLEKGQGNIVDRPNPNRPIDQAPNQTPSSRAQSNLDRINQELSDLYAENPPNPGAIENKKRQQQQAAAAAMGEGQKDLVSTAVSRPEELATKTAVAQIDPNTVGTTIAQGTGDAGAAGQATATQTGAAQQATAPTGITPASMQATTTQGAVQGAVSGVTAAQGTVSSGAEVTAAQGSVSEGAKAKAETFDPKYIDSVGSGDRVVSQEELAKAEGLDENAVKAKIAQADVPDNIKAAQTSVSAKEIPEPAQIKDADMASAKAITDAGLNDDAIAVAAKLAKFSVDAETLAAFKEGKIEAEDTVQGQLASLMKDFDDGTPVWAAGAMRAANAAMAARGLGGSSMAAAAIVQASMESAIPIASADATAFRQMNLDNLNRQQQVSLANAAAQQGVEISNFNADQQTALQNSQNSFSLQGQNLSNKQSVVLANAQIKASLQGQNLSNQQQANIVEAARYAEVANLNLNNRQQSVLQDNANRMQVNLANMSSKQQSYIANAQIASALQGKQIDNAQQVSIINAAKFAEANNLTFTAAEQIKIHNSELMKTIGLAELNSAQAATLQNAATMANMDMANLSNAQQAAVQNAQNFLQMDMANLNNSQQVELFKAQSIQQAILSDAAADNAAKQFNASSENQTNQFMSNLNAQVSQFNASQSNALAQFNVGEVNAIAKFNEEQNNAREEFNTKNALIIAQANAQWRQATTTTNTAAQNEANMQDAKAMNAFTASTLDQVWQRERDLLSYAWQSSESGLDRIQQIIIANIQATSAADTNAATNAASVQAAAVSAEGSKWGAIGAALLGINWG